MAGFEIAPLEASALAQSPGLCRARLDAGAAGVVVRGFWDAQRAARAASAVLARRDAWVSDFGGLQFCLGRAWYTHLETARTAAYFAAAASADALVEATVPGLQAELRGSVAHVTAGPVRARRGWCGAGVHVFPAGGACARSGGDVHVDDEGLSRAQRRTRSAALSLVLMLQPADAGGALRLWDVLAPGGARPTDVPWCDVPASPGDLVVFDSWRLHQIQPFSGDRDRISATLHAADTGADWETWF